MKKIFTILSLTCIVSLSSNAQCVGGVSNCNPDPTTPSATFKPTPANLACAVKGSVYNESISFKIPASVTQPQAVDLDSVQVVSMSNLPCGLCYSFNKAGKKYNANEVGCFTISGTTNDAVGQYTVDIQMLACASNPPITIGSLLVPSTSPSTTANECDCVTLCDSAIISRGIFFIVRKLKTFFYLQTSF
jgi:hypothetical protein